MALLGKGAKFGVGVSTACEKVNAAGTDGARVLPLKLVPGTVPKFVLGHQQKAMFRLVPGYRSQASSLNGALHVKSFYCYFLY